MAGYSQRRSKLDVTEVDDGLVLYDSASDRVHYLNPTAAFVYLCCDGDRDAAAITEMARTMQGVGATITVADIESCLSTLADEGVLE